MSKFYEEVDIVFTARVVRLKDRGDNWLGDLYGQLDYLLRSDKHMLVGLSKIDAHTKGEKNETTHPT